MRAINKYMSVLGIFIDIKWSNNRLLIPACLLGHSAANKFGTYTYRIVIKKSVDDVAKFWRSKRNPYDPYQGGFSMFAPRRNKL